MSESQVTPAACEISEPDPDVDRFVRVSQINSLFTLSPFSAFICLSVVPVFAGSIWSEQRSVYLSLTVAAIVILACTLLGLCFYWRRLIKTSQLPRYTEGLVVLLSLMLGCMVATMPAVLFPEAGHEQRLLIACCAAGFIATGMVFAPVPWAALCYSGAIVAGSFIGLYRTGEIFYIIIGLLLALYAVFIMAMITLFHRLMIKLAVDQARIDKQRHVISLLLNDFEEGSSDWLWNTDVRHAFQHVSARFAEVAGVGRQVLQRRALDDLVGEPLRCGVAMPESGQLLRHLEQHSAFRGLVVPIMRDGEQRWWSLTGHPVFDARDEFCGFRGVGSDVTEAKRSESRIAYLARYDSLTGLPNRRVFIDELVRACRRANESNTSYAVLRVDVKGLKSINDTLGNSAGDQVLMTVASRIRQNAHEEDCVARFAGDEFIVLAEKLGVEGAAELARCIIKAVAVPFAVKGEYINAAISIGIVVTAQETVDEPLNQAGLALHRAKEENSGGYVFYESGMDARLQARRAIEAELRGALTRKEFELRFQPIVSLETGFVTSLEALLRWKSPTLGQVSPTEFIPVAEDIGLIDRIGEWVIAEACRIAAGWARPVRVAVNLSVQQFRSPTLGLAVARALAETGLAANRLELEITESIFIGRNDHALDMLHDLKALGVRIALDDFGTGYSSLSYLQLFPFDKIKIDQTFVRNLPHNSESRVIIQAIAMFATHFGMTITAEGVETEEQLSQLREIGCGEAQGFLFNRPEPAQNIPALLARLEPAPHAA